jgi:IS605 OrfB family transposase
MSYLPVMMTGWDGSAAGAGPVFRRRPGRCGPRWAALRATPARIPGGDRVTRLREIAAPFVAAAPAGARVRARLRISPQDAEVLAAAGRHLGSLAGRDLAARCAEGKLDAKGRAASRAVRKRALTAASSSRWAGAITRTSEDAWQLAARNLAVGRATLQARVRRIEARLAVPAGNKTGRVNGYATPAERHAKTLRLKALKGRLARVERQTADGRVSVTRGGRRLLRARLNLQDVGLTGAQWRQRWDAARLFLTADGEKDKAWGNETIRWHPDEGWLEVKLPAPLAHLANRPHGRYRLSCVVAFAYRGDEVAAQAATGAVRYDISYDPVKDRWHLDASWKAPARPRPDLGALRRSPVVAVDVNHGHLAVAVLAPDGNITGGPFTIPLELAGRPATTRDGRVRAAVSRLIATAREHGARAVVIEDLDFAQARREGREETGNRPARGRRGRRFRRLVAGIPTARFRDRLIQMTANAGLSVIVADPAYTSRWGAQHWLAPLRQHHPETTGHHAAALVIGRRGQGHRARLRANGNRAAPENAARPARARTRNHPVPPAAPRKPAAPRGTRQPPRGKTGMPHRTTAGDQVPEDRSRAPTEPVLTTARC